MFHCRSISHHHTPLVIREQLSLTARQQTEWLAAPRREEVLVVATCNRLELYAYTPSTQAMNALWADLLAQRHVKPQEVEAVHDGAVRVRRGAAPIPRKLRAGVDGAGRAANPGADLARL